MWLANDGAGRRTRSSIGAAVIVGELRPVFLGSHSDTDGLGKAPGEAWKNLKQTSVQPRVPKSSQANKPAPLAAGKQPVHFCSLGVKIRQVTCQVRDQQIFTIPRGWESQSWILGTRAVRSCTLSCPLLTGVRFVTWGNTVIKFFPPSSYASLGVHTGVGYRVHRPQSRFRANGVGDQTIEATWERVFKDIGSTTAEWHLVS